MPSVRRNPTSAAPPKARAQARALRQLMTEPEKHLWWHLRHRLPVEGTHFRRQVPIDGFIADFCCVGARIILEVDGNQHGFNENARRDAQRTHHLEAGGYRVLRFSNGEVMTSIDIVLDTIRAALPSPVRGEEFP